LSFVLLDVTFRRSFKRADISFPSSLGGCGILFATLLALPAAASDDIYAKLQPGAALLAKWLPVFFVPSLITLPLADPVGSAAEIFKVGAVIVGGFLFTLLTTSYSVVAVRKLMSSDQQQKSITVVAAARRRETRDVKTKKAFSDELFNSLWLLSCGTATAALLTTFTATSLHGPATSLFLLFTTLTSFVYGARLPKSFTKLVHPLVTCTALTWLVAAAFGKQTKVGFRGILHSYTTGGLKGFRSGPGDILLFLLGPSVVSFAVSMYERRKLMRENLAEVGTAVGVSTVGGIFGTAWAVRALDIASPYLRLSLLSRNITSPLAMAIASILGADVSLAVSMVVVTGVIGANFGASLLNAVGIKDAVARGLGIGAAARKWHSLGFCECSTYR
jgi:putative effector of murein hydrolase